MTFLLMLSMMSAGGAAPAAGTATRIVPNVQIFHGHAKSALNEKDTVGENDRIRTEAKGRARIVLGDGSILNVGSDSQMTIKATATQAGPAAVELAFGKMRAEINKRVNGGAAFEVRTSTAICGVLGTTLYVEQDKKHSHVINISPLDSGSQVKVRSANKKIKEEVTLNPGQGTLVYKGKAPSPPHVMGEVDRTQARTDTEAN